MRAVDEKTVRKVTDEVFRKIAFEADRMYGQSEEECGNNKEFSLDTREMRAILGDVPLTAPEISSYLKDYLTENKLETDGGSVY